MFEYRLLMLPSTGGIDDPVVIKAHPIDPFAYLLESSRASQGDDGGQGSEQL
jgi:hypothetical protein